MARKNLLTESELRSFMKLAELRPLADAKVNELYTSDEVVEERDDDELERELGATEDELGDEDALADEEADELGDMDMDMDMDMAADDDAGAPDMVSVQDMLSALETALEDVLDVPVSAEMDDEEGAAGMDAAMDADIDMETDMAMDAEEEEDVPGMRDIYEDQDALVNEVAKRVLSRLQEKSEKANMVDALAERIMKRLTQ